MSNGYEIGGLRLPAASSRRNQFEFQMETLETQLSGVHLSVVDDDISHSQSLEFLGRKGPNLLMRNLKDKDTICRRLLNMAEKVKVLPPGNEALPWDVLNMSLWKDSLGELIKEMKTVEVKCPSLIGNSSVYVLTSSPYAAFLRALAAEIGDRLRTL